jgi:Flp pilus assembly protein TadD
MKIRFAPLAVLALLAVGCANEGDAARTTVGQEMGEEPRSTLAADVQAPIDAGNQAYRNRDFAEALAHYRTATERAPNEATAWFGVAMAADAMGNRELADSARVRIEALAPELNVAGHTEATPNGHP